VFARLRPGISLRQADAEIRTLGRHLDSAAPELGLTLLPASRAVVPTQIRFFGGLFGTAVVALSGLLVLIACANLVSLFIARTASRAHEVAVRIALGASPQSIFRTSVIEAAVLTLIGGGAGVAFAISALRILGAISLPEIGGIVVRIDPSPDLRFFTYSFVLLVGVSVLLGYLPSRVASAIQPSRALGSTGTGVALPTAGKRYRTLAVAIQLAASVVLLTASGLFIRSTVAAQLLTPQFDAAEVITGRLDLALQKLPEARGKLFHRELLAQLSLEADVKSAALGSGLPYAHEGVPVKVLPVGQSDRSINARSLIVSHRFVNTVGLRIRHGRDFAASDVMGAAEVVLVSESLAVALWPQQNPIGQRIKLGQRGGSAEVVGVVSDTELAGGGTDTDHYVFRPLDQQYDPRVALFVKNQPGRTVNIRDAVFRADADVALFDVASLETRVGLVAASSRIAAIILGSVGTIGLMLAGMGVFGVVRLAVELRRQEFGVMRALGASPRHIYAALIPDIARLLVKGLIPGWILAFLSAGVLEHTLVGISTHDWVTFTVVPSVLLLVGAVASLLPVRRALALDPSIVMKSL
jgi:predicted permease